MEVVLGGTIPINLGGGVQTSITVQFASTAAASGVRVVQPIDMDLSHHTPVQITSAGTPLLQMQLQFTSQDPILSQVLPQVTQLRTLHTAFAFLVVGIGLKLAMFPLHLWMPNAYAFAPSTATVFIAATATKVAVYILLRFVFTVVGPVVAYEDLPFGEIATMRAGLSFSETSTRSSSAPLTSSARRARIA